MSRKNRERRAENRARKMRESDLVEINIGVKGKEERFLLEREQAHEMFSGLRQALAEGMEDEKEKG